MRFQRYEGLKCGDSTVGKTHLLSSYIANASPDKRIPLVIFDYSVNVMVDGHPIDLYLWDTGEGLAYDRLREGGLTPISRTQGMAMAEEIKAAEYLECSAVNHQGLVFGEAIHTVLCRRQKPKDKKCPIL